MTFKNKENHLKVNTITPSQTITFSELLMVFGCIKNIFLFGCIKNTITYQNIMFGCKIFEET